MKPDESFVAQPIRSLQTMLRTISQVDPEQLSVIPDGVYSAQTAAAVRSFQGKHDLPQTGVADQDTWDAVVQFYRMAKVETEPAEPIFITLNPGQVFCGGDQHHHIALVQAMLGVIALAYPDFPAPMISGTFDRCTEEAILTLQKLCALQTNGLLDKMTWKHLVRHHGAAADKLERQRTVNFF